MIRVESPDDLSPQAKDVSGQTFTRLTPLLPLEERRHGQVVWLCHCSCGNLHTTTTNKLLKDHTKSCGCLVHEANRPDLAGKQIGRLTVLEPTNQFKNGNNRLWRCQCSCGETTLVRGSNLNSSDPTRSCGCWRRELSSERMSGKTGPDAHAWKGGNTPEFQLIRTSEKYANWRTAVFNRDEYTCQKCDTEARGRLNAHHILPFAQHPSYRFNVDNGITLCEDCHQSFHQQYGKRLCDRVDLMEWL